MRITAKHKFARISPQKVKLVSDQIRGLPVERAVELLAFSQKKAGRIVGKVLNSAIANAEHNENADIDELKVEEIFVGRGSIYKRIRARARGRVNRIKKRTSNITVAVSDS